MNNEWAQKYILKCPIYTKLHSSTRKVPVLHRNLSLRDLFSGTEWIVIWSTVHDETAWQFCTPSTHIRESKFFRYLLVREAGCSAFLVHNSTSLQLNNSSTVHTQPPWEEECSPWWESWLHCSHNSTDPRPQICRHPTHPKHQRLLYLADHVLS